MFNGLKTIFITNREILLWTFKKKRSKEKTDSEKEKDIVVWLREVGMPADYVNRLLRSIR